MYTIGIKRRFWFGFREVQVNSHGWQDGRIILNLIDGSQEQIPGYAVYCLKVYNDFHKHAEMVLEAQQEKERRAEARRLQEEEQARLQIERMELEALRSQRRFEPAPIPRIDNPLPVDTYKEDMENEVLRRATQRINSLLT